MQHTSAALESTLAQIGQSRHEIFFVSFAASYSNAVPKFTVGKNPEDVTHETSMWCRRTNLKIAAWYLNDKPSLWLSIMCFRYGKRRYADSPSWLGLLVFGCDEVREEGVSSSATPIVVAAVCWWCVSTSVASSHLRINYETYNNTDPVSNKTTFIKRNTLCTL